MSPANESSKKCPFCAEIIPYEAIKCKHCLERVDERSSLHKKKYINPVIVKFLVRSSAFLTSLVIVLLCVVVIVWLSVAFLDNVFPLSDDRATGEAIAKGLGVGVCLFAIGMWKATYNKIKKFHGLT